MLFLVAALALATGACSDSNGPDGSGDSMTAKVNGKSIELNSVFWGVRTSDFFAAGSPDIGINQETVEISAVNITAPGTYTIGGNGTVKVTGEYTLAGSDIPYTTTRVDKRVAGTLTLTAIDTTQLKGTFSFTAWDPKNPSDSVVVTDGTLNLVKDY